MTVTNRREASAASSQQSPGQQLADHGLPVVVVGGGIAGLVAANQAAHSGCPVVLLEKAGGLGGRAATRERHGFYFNLGPHALYRSGVLRETLRRFGVEPHGAIPGGSGGFALYQGRAHTLPAGFVSLITTGLLRLPAKIEFAKLLAGIGAVDASAVQHDPLGVWLERHVRHEMVRELLKMLVRVTTFTHDPDRQSAGAAIEQLQLGAKGNVLYLDRGWQTIVDGLRRSAIASGVQIKEGAPAVSLSPAGRRRVSAVRLADGTEIAAGAAILTGSPADVDALAGTSFASTLPPPVRLATLDVGLRTLPRPKRLVAFGVDSPVYFSVHSAVAALAPEGGALVHVARYLRPDENAGGDVARSLERVLDQLQPGWRDVLETRQFLPNLTVTHAELVADRGGLAGRPAPRLDRFDNVFIAGDWVGARGQLSDAAAASATAAADAAVAAAGRVVCDPPARGGSRSEGPRDARAAAVGV